MTYGKPAFTQSELDAEAAEEAKRKQEFTDKLENGFFKHGESRPIFIDEIIKEEKVGKISGKPYTDHTYYVRDADTDTKEIVDIRNHGFAFTSALAPVKKELGVKFLLGVTKLNVFTEKTGDREYNGFTSPVFKFDITVLSNEVTEEGKKASEEAMKDPNEVDVESIPF